MPIQPEIFDTDFLARGYDLAEYNFSLFTNQTNRHPYHPEQRSGDHDFHWPLDREDNIPGTTEGESSKTDIPNLINAARLNEDDFFMALVTEIPSPVTVYGNHGKSPGWIPPNNYTVSF